MKASASTEARAAAAQQPDLRQPWGPRWSWMAAALIAAFVLFAGIHAATAPTGQTGYQDAPDEAAHVAYVRAVHDGRLPSPGDQARDPRKQSYEWHQPPLYYALAAAAWPLGERGMRAVSIAFAAAGLLLVLLAARELWPHDPLYAITALALAALIPGHIAINSVVNNDALLELCFDAALYIGVISLVRGITSGRAVALGAAAGLAVLTKTTGLLLVPIMLALYGILWLRGQPARRVAAHCATTIALLLLLPGWWFARNVRHFGQPVPLGAFNAMFGGTAQARDFVGALGWGGYAELVANWTFRSFWAVYGTPAGAARGLPAFLPDQVYVVAALLCLVGIAGLVALHFRRIAPERAAAVRFLLFALGVVVCAFAAFVAKYFQAQGRYLYPAMLAIAILFAAGWRTAIPARYSVTSTVLLVGLLLAMDAAFLRYALP